MSNSIDNVLFSLECSATQLGAFSRRLNARNKEDRKRLAVRSGLESITQYVQSGRASKSWIDALSKAEPENLLLYMSKDGPCSSEEDIKHATTFLRKYCNLKKNAQNNINSK